MTSTTMTAESLKAQQPTHQPAATAAKPQATPRAGLWEKYRAASGGLLEYWYPVCKVTELKRRKRMTLEIAEKKLVLFHEGGKAHAMLDECPHRLVPLSMGLHEFPGHISCFYHGWTFNLQTGRLAATLTDGPNAALDNKVSVRVFPAEERIGLVFVWMGDGDPVPVEEDIPTELLRDDARIHMFFRKVEGNWRHACENGFDESHVKMLHRYTLWTFFRNIPAWNETAIHKSADGVWLQRSQNAVHLFANYPGLGKWPKKRFWKPSPSAGGVTTGGSDHGVDIRLPSILRVKQPGKADWSHYEFYVPSTEDSYYYLTVAVSWRKSVFKRLTWWLRYWIYILWIHHHGFNGDDLKVVAVTPESAPARAFRPDISVIEWRRHVENNARQPSSSRPPVQG